LSNDLDVIEFKELTECLPEYKGMLEVIKAGVPEITRATSLFGKRQSQFMDNMLTIKKPTPIRNLRQIAAEMNKINEALTETYHKCRRKEVERQIALRDAEVETDELKKQLFFIDADQKASELRATKNYMGGSIRKLANYQKQYDSILASMGKSTFSEIDFEQEEERYHIMTAFEQGLSAARSRQGVVDEGNQIYFTDVGINGSVGSKCVRGYLALEEKLFKAGDEPDYDMQLKFLNDMADKFKGCSMRLAEHKGMTTLTKEAALERGDTRLLDGL
jgi:hypothetical protein